MEDGVHYAEALLRAQMLGYAEADARCDVDGTDAAHKLALLVQLGFHLAVLSPRIRRTGITSIRRSDVARARMLGFRIRLVAAALRTDDGVAAEVAPLLIAEEHAFAQTRGADNIARIVSRDAGTLELRGAGAGGAATASALLGDVVSALRAIGERHDFAQRGRTSGMLPALDVRPLFGAFAHHPELPHLAVWDDTLPELRQPLIAGKGR
jgi:homoserine dehydrogenase